MGHKEALDAALKVAELVAEKGEEMMMAQHAEIERLQALNAELVAALKRMMEIAEEAMPDSYFQSDSRVNASQIALKKAQSQ